MKSIQEIEAEMVRLEEQAKVAMNENKMWVYDTTQGRMTALRWVLERE